jgi:hypothetical protein
MKFEQGNTLIFEGGKDYAAKLGAKAIFIKSIGDFIEVEWIRDELSGKQMDGCYSSSMFAKVEEVFEQKEDRIFEQNKSDMKFDFEKGKKLLMEYFQSDLERGEIYTLQTIKGSDNFEDIENEIDSFRYFKNDIENTIQLINQSKTLSEVFVALINTDLEDDEETILSFFIEGLK